MRGKKDEYIFEEGIFSKGFFFSLFCVILVSGSTFIKRDSNERN